MKKRFPNGIKACGADALRFAMLRHDFTDFEIHIDIPRFADEGRRFCNKIWNMCKYYEKVRKLYDEISLEVDVLKELQSPNRKRNEDVCVNFEKLKKNFFLEC